MALPKLFEDSTEVFTRNSTAKNYTGENVTANTKREKAIPSSAFCFETLPRLPKEVDETLLTLATIDTFVNNIVANNPNVIKKSYGTSVQNRELYYLRLGQSTSKQVVLIACGIHGDEIRSLRGWLTAFNWLANSKAELAREFRSHYDMILIPTVNPDATNTLTRNNVNNVNLNRNWPYFFSSVSDTDKGAFPFSEPETRYLASALFSIRKRIQLVVDVHDWSSKTTFGFLTEQIYHNIRSSDLQRSTMGFINAALSNADYTPINTPLKLTEYRSKRKSYLYTHFRTYGAPSALGCLVELPEAELVSTVCSIAQDCLIGIAASAVNFANGTQTAAILEQTTIVGTPLPTATNPNAHFTLWNTAQRRPQYFSFSRLKLEQLDAGSEKAVQSERPEEENLSTPIAKAAVGTQTQADGTVNLWYCGGHSGTSYQSSIKIHKQATGRTKKVGSINTPRQELKGTISGNTLMVICGGYNGTYIDEIQSATLSDTAMSFSNIHTGKMLLGAKQRHSVAGSGTSSKVYISGGRNATGYSDDVICLDTNTGFQWLAAKLASPIGWHTSFVDSTGDLSILGGWTGASRTTNVWLLQTSNITTPVYGNDGILSSGNFSSASIDLSSLVVGQHITLQYLTSDNTNQTYYPQILVITALIDANNVSISIYAGASYPNISGMTFTITPAPSILSVPRFLVANLTTAVRDFAVSYTDSNTGYLQGGDTASGLTDAVIKYDLTGYAGYILAYITPLMSSTTNIETGVITSTERPQLRAAIGYAQTGTNDNLVILGGEDELGIKRQEIYDIDLAIEAETTQRAGDIATYGYFRPATAIPIALNERYVISAQVKNGKDNTVDRNPFVRLVTRLGSLANPVRDIRTWYQVPPSDNYMTIMTVVEILASDLTGEANLRSYLRHYTAGTKLHIKNFSITKLNSNNSILQMPTPEAITPEDDSSVVSMNVPVNSVLPFTLYGSVVPLVVANSSNTTKLLELKTGAVSNITVTITDTFDTASNSSNNSIITLVNSANGTSQTVSGFDTNYNRSSGKEFRNDPIHWKLINYGDKPAVLKLNYYGITKTLSLLDLTAFTADTILLTNGIHTAPKLQFASLIRNTPDHGDSMAIDYKALLFKEYTGTGSNTDFQYTAPYMSTADILASVDGTLTTLTPVDATTFRMATPPAAGTRVVLWRDSNQSAAEITFPPDGNITSNDLNLATLQQLYLNQEILAEMDLGTRCVFHQSVAPTTANDVTKGFGQGSCWAVTGGSVYMSTSNTQAAPGWIEIANSGNYLATTPPPPPLG